MKTRIIHTKFWSDGFVSSLKHKEKLLFLYLFTNEKVNICGIYELPDKYIRADLELTQRELDNAKEKLQKSRKFIFKDGWIKIINVEKYNSYSGEKNEIANKKELSYVPDNFVEYARGIDTSIDTSIDTLSNKKSEIRNKKLVIRNQYKSIKDLKEKDLKEISEKYKVPLEFVEVIFDRMRNWLESKGKKYENYKMALMNWVSRSKEERIGRSNYADRTRGIDATDL